MLRPFHWLHRASLLTAAMTLFAAVPAAAQPAVPQGVWLIDGKAAVQVYDCAGLICGRIIWLKETRTLTRVPHGVSTGWC